MPKILFLVSYISLCVSTLILYDICNRLAGKIRMLEIRNERNEDNHWHLVYEVDILKKVVEKAMEEGELGNGL